jgi:hypothetical protein
MPGPTLRARDLRALAPRTLLFSGTKTVADGVASVTAVDTLENVLDNQELPWSLDGGEIVLPDGGFFLVSLVGVFVANPNGTTRRVHLRITHLNGQADDSRLAPLAQCPFTTPSDTGLHARGTIPIPFEPRDRLQVHGRQDSGGSLDVTVWLSLTQLPSD